MSEKKPEVLIDVTKTSKKELEKLTSEQLISQLFMAHGVIKAKTELSDINAKTVLSQNKKINEITEKNSTLASLATKLNKELEVTSSLLKLKL